MRVVVNTSPLISLERIDQLDLLRRLFGRVIRPQSVLDELLAGQPRYELSSELTDASWILTEPDPPEMELRKELGAGETAAIALAHRTGADLVVLDDLQARLVAESLGLTVTGTLGVLVAARDEGFLDDPGGAVTALKKAGFRISEALLESAGL